MSKKSEKNHSCMSRDKKRKMILSYARNIYAKENRFISKREIRNKFHLEVYNYFENIFDLYQHIGIDVPHRFCPRNYA